MIKLYFIFLFIYSSLFSFGQNIPDRIPFFQNNHWGFCDTSRKIVIPCKYLKVMTFSGNYAAVMDTFAYWGFINKNGDEIIKPIYESAEGFKNGFCRVKKDEMFGFLDSRLKEVVPTKLKEICDEAAASLVKGGAAVCNKQILDTSCTIKLLDKYDETGPFSEGLIWVTKGAKGGFVNKNAEETIPLSDLSEGENKPAFSEGLCGLKKAGNYGYIDKTGKETSSFIYDGGYPYQDGRTIIIKNWKYGFIDKNGKELTPLTYDYLLPYSEGLAIAVNKDKYGFIDEKGRLVIPFQYHRAYSFSKGYAMALHLAKYFIIDKKGKKVSKDYEFMTYVTKGGFYQTMDKKKYGVVNYDGKELIPCIYRDIPYFNYELNIGIVQNIDGKYGLINNKGKFIIPCKYDFLEIRSGNLIYAEFMNIEGKGKEVKSVFVGDKFCDRAFLLQGFFDITGKKYFD